jgi:hypothetical protein
VKIDRGQSKRRVYHIANGDEMNGRSPKAFLGKRGCEIDGKEMATKSQLYGGEAVMIEGWLRSTMVYFDFSSGPVATS